MKEMYKKNKFKAIVSIAVALVFISPVAAFTNFEEMNVSSSDVDISNNVDEDLQTLDETLSDDMPEPPEVLNSVEWWPMFRHDSRNTGYSTSTAPDINNVLWTYTTTFTEPDEEWASPVVVDDKIYCYYERTGGDYRDGIVCLNASDGSLIWENATYITPSDNNLGSPAVVDGKVYVGSADKNFYCLDAQNGSVIWEYPTHNCRVAGIPTVVDGKVFFGTRDSAHHSYDGSLYCLDASNGSLVWRNIMGCDVPNAPAVVDGRVFISVFDDIYCFDATNGSLIWQYTTGTSLTIATSPSVVDGKVFIGSNDENLYCLDASNGSLNWSYRTNGIISSSPAVVDGKVYFGSRDTNVYCLDATNGSLIWKSTPGGAMIAYSSPAIIDGKMFLGDSNGEFFCLDPSDGSLIWKYKTGGLTVFTSPAIADGKVFLGGRDGNLYCFGLADHDVGVTSIVSPVSGIAGVFTPEVSVKNFGLNTETDVPVNMQIFKSTEAWTEIVYNGTGQWEQRDYDSAGYSKPPGAGLYFAQACPWEHDSDLFDVGLFTTSQDLSGHSNVTLEFEVNVYFSGNDRAEVNTYSGGMDPANFEEELINYTDGNYPGIHQTLYFDPSGYNDSSDVYIEFYYTTGEMGAYRWFSIDDISIAATGLSEGFEVAFPPIELAAIPEYNETEILDTINVGETKVVTLLDWTPEDLPTATGFIDYAIVASTQLTTDGNPDTDCLVETITLNFVEEDYYDLTMSVVGNGTTTPEAGVTHSYPSGTVVPLEAFPDSGWEFDAWSGDITTTDNPTNITMDGNKSVTATFTEIQIFYLTMSVVGSGTTDPAVGVHSYSSGTVVTLTAIADSGWVFDQWGGDMTGSTNPDTITMDGNKSVTATFVEEECPIEIEISGGFGVNAIIRNIGEEDVTGLEYSIALDGGLILLPIGGVDSGTVDIPADGEVSVRAGVLGLGKTEITVTAGCAEETATGLVLIVFVIVI